jgi:hypothetical protein
VTLWADPDVIHLLIAGTRIKTVRSHLSVADLTALLRQGGRSAGPPPMLGPQPGDVVEVDRTVDRYGSVSLGQHQVVAADILGPPGRHPHRHHDVVVLRPRIPAAATDPAESAHPGRGGPAAGCSPSRATTGAVALAGAAAGV